MPIMALLLTPGVVVSSAFAAGDANQGACPNEVLRQELHSGGLPDCRAYEMVSPVFTDGVAFHPEALSTDGSQVIGVAKGAFAGTENLSTNQLAGALYELSRTDAGWAASALDPPASLSSESLSLAASKDLTRTLWELREPAQSAYEGDLYLREPDGSFHKIGPVVPPSRGVGPPAGVNGAIAFGATIVYIAASADLSRVFMSYRPQEKQGGGEEGNILWPGDTTQVAGRSLYEYSGTAVTRPELVGVNNEGKLLSNCGTELGGDVSQEKYDAVSSSGERVFFTALHATGNGVECLTPAVNELYARLDRAETVAISEPSSFQCGKCVTSARRAAEFQGASEDGSKVFFTTEQELLEGNTGENLYEYDFGDGQGEKIVRVSTGSPAPEVQGVARVSQDGSHVYFVAKGILTEGKNAEGQEPVAGGENLYVFERDAAYPQGRVTFLATLFEEDAVDWGEADFRPVQATPDGRFVVFTSAAPLTAYKEEDTSTVSQVFEYDAAEERLVRVSVGQKSAASPEGFNKDGNTEVDPAQIESPVFEESTVPTAAQSGLDVSSDGSYVVFTSSDALTPQAVEAANAQSGSVYEYHSVGPVTNGNVYLISDGKDVTQHGHFPHWIDASGHDVFFPTSDPLVAQDANTEADIYDARVNGGVLMPAAPVACEGEMCQGAPGSAQSFGSPTSSSPGPDGNLAVPSVKSAPKRPRLLTRSEKLAKALKACRRSNKTKSKRDNKTKSERAACEAHARKTYGEKPKGKKSARSRT
jgi:hypothetical protein